MNQYGVINIRRLVEQAQELRAPVPPKKEHPLGLGLPESHSLSPSEGGTGGPKLRLPKVAGGLQALQTTVAQQILDLTPDQACTAWYSLLTKPGLCVPLRTPRPSELLESGFPVSEDSASRVRAVALASVLRYQRVSSQEGRQSDTLEMRIAAVGRLVVVTVQNHPAVSLEAWADIRWVRSARALSRVLESLYNDATPAAQRTGKRRTAMLLLGDELADAVDAVADTDIERTLSCVAAVHGYSLSVLRSPRRFAGSVLDAVLAASPSLLVIAAPSGSQVDGVISAYRNATASSRVSNLGECDFNELINDFREELGAAAGVSPALDLRSSDESAEVKDATNTEFRVPGVWPVEHPGQRKIHEQFGLFVENLDDGHWYSRDRAGHADTVIKSYRRISRLLKHEADYAADGKPIPKHKGQIGAVVSLDDMRGI